MPDPVHISVFGVVGSTKCVAAEDGQKVFERIAPALRSGRIVHLSFLNVDGLTSAFLNPAIGQLYGEFEEDLIRSNLAVTELDPGDLSILKQVVDTAKLYFREPERVRAANRAVVGDDDVD